MILEKSFFSATTCSSTLNWRMKQNVVWKLWKNSCALSLFFFFFAISSPVGWRLSSVAAQPHGALPERWSTCHIWRRWELLFVWHSLQCQSPCAWLSLTFGQIYNLTWVDRQMPITPSSLSLTIRQTTTDFTCVKCLHFATCSLFLYLCQVESFTN